MEYQSNHQRKRKRSNDTNHHSSCSKHKRNTRSSNNDKDISDQTCSSFLPLVKSACLQSNESMNFIEKLIEHLSKSFHDNVQDRSSHKYDWIIFPTSIRHKEKQKKNPSELSDRFILNMLTFTSNKLKIKLEVPDDVKSMLLEKKRNRKKMNPLNFVV